jgi:hypothetical protein
MRLQATIECPLLCTTARQPARLCTQLCMQPPFEDRVQCVCLPTIDAMQTQLKEEHEKALCDALPGLSASDVALMKRAPSRCYDPNITQDPHIYRMQEAVLHFGQSIKTLVNEKVRAQPVVCSLNSPSAANALGLVLGFVDAPATTLSHVTL